MLFDDAVYIGKVVKYHSSRNDILVSFTDYSTIENGNKNLIIEINGLKVPFHIENAEMKGNNTFYLHLSEIKGENDALEIIGCKVFAPVEEVEKADYSEIPSLRFFIGYQVFDKAEGWLGEVSDVDESSINMLLYINKDGKEIIIPFNEDFIQNFNPHKRVLELDLPEGLTDINQ